MYSNGCENGSEVGHAGQQRRHENSRVAAAPMAAVAATGAAAAAAAADHLATSSRLNSRPGSQGKYGADGLLALGLELRPGSRGTHVNQSTEIAFAKFLEATNSGEKWCAAAAAVGARSA